MGSKDNQKIIENLKGVHPKFAKHVFLKNKILEYFAKSFYGGIDILEQPMCRKCEKPAAWDTNGTAKCFICGTVTKDPITLREYLSQELKLGKEELELIERGLRDEEESIFNE